MLDAMRDAGRWLTTNWPDALTALATVATLIVVLRDRWRPPDFPLNAELTVCREGGDMQARLTFIRPTSGFLCFESLEASGWLLSPTFSHGDAYGNPEDTGERLWQRRLSPPQEYGRAMRSIGHSDLATLVFWVRRSTSSKASNVMRLKLIARWRSDRTLRKTSTIESNAID